MLDYSATTTPQQNEGAGLSQAAGLAPVDLKKYHVIYQKTNLGKVIVDTAKSGIDFNGDGHTDDVIPSTRTDINALASPVAGCGPQSGEIENSYNDWNEINLVFLPDPDSVDGVTKAASDPYTGVIEVTPTFKAEIKAKAFDQRVIFAPYPNTDGTSTFKVGSDVPFVFVLLDKNNKFIKNAMVTFVAEKGPTKIVGSFHTDLKNLLYHFNWMTPNTVQAKGQWTISYFKDYQTPNQALLQGPQAQASGGLFTLKITGK